MVKKYLTLNLTVMKILIVTPENERIQLSRISIAEVDAIIPGLPSLSKLLN
jgi:hypothetical protein